MLRSGFARFVRCTQVCRHYTGSTPATRPENEPQEFTKLNLEEVEFRQPAFKNEDIESKRKRLSYQSSKRGMLEMDNLFGGFAYAHLQTMSDRELSEYDSILRETDTHLYAWLVKREDVPEDISELATYQRLDRFATSGELESVRDHLIGQ
jgi:succinate dehydrogenase flavin-adding protein (antitoxin of CptAB toxin-antitoxin module)